MTRTEMKKQLINEIAASLKSYGYTVYIAKSGEYGFYTDGARVVSFGGHYDWSVDFSGSYNAGRNAIYCGTGWGFENGKELTGIDAHTAETFIKSGAPRWATRGYEVTYTTPEQHLKTYGSSSGYVEFAGE